MRDRFCLFFNGSLVRHHEAFGIHSSIFIHEFDLDITFVVFQKVVNIFLRIHRLAIHFYYDVVVHNANLGHFSTIDHIFRHYTAVQSVICFKSIAEWFKVRPNFF